MKFLLGFVAAILVVGIAAAMILLSFDVAALTPEAAPVSAILHAIMRRSVQSRAGIERRETWSNAELRKGFEEYDEMCVVCLAAPGQERTPISNGMRPQPPDLAQTSRQWTTAQLFWIVKNGVKMTGMPAFGATHSDANIWSIVGFVRGLPRLTADQFRALESQAGVSKHEEEAHHDRL